MTDAQDRLTDELNRLGLIASEDSPKRRSDAGKKQRLRVSLALLFVTLAVLTISLLIGLVVLAILLGAVVVVDMFAVWDAMNHAEAKT